MDLAEALDPRRVDVNLPAYLCAKRCRVSRQLFYTWVKAGDIEPVDEAPDGRPLYHLRRALEVERDKRRSGSSHRGPRPA